jgi:hypothetical protein
MLSFQNGDVSFMANRVSDESESMAITKMQVPLFLFA